MRPSRAWRDVLLDPAATRWLVDLLPGAGLKHCRPNPFTYAWADVLPRLLDVTPNVLTRQRMVAKPVIFLSFYATPPFW